MVNRREFVRHSSALGFALIAPGVDSKEAFYSGLEEIQKAASQQSEEMLITDKKFWLKVRSMFNPPKGFINLENGYFSPQPLSTLHKQRHYLNDLNQRSSFLMRREQTEILYEAKTALSDFAQIPSSEIVICRNTTEALDTIIHGYPWKKRDEVVLAHQDYYSMRAAFEQEVRRNGIRTKYVDLPLDPKSDEEIVRRYENAITKKTRLLLITHIIHLTGQILPVEKIARMAKAHGVEVMLDAAHSFSHIPLRIKDLGIDYLGTSLHKWLSAPVGLGMMYIKQEHIDKIWPLFGDNEFAKSDIRKFEHWGTRPISTISCIKHAIDFHNALGASLKTKRLNHLKAYWLNKALDFEGFKSNTPTEMNRSCAIANFAIRSTSPDQVAQQLLERFDVFTVAINEPLVKGVRVTPHLYNMESELDTLLEGIEYICP